MRFNIFRRTMAVLLAAATVFSLSACNKKPTEPEVPERLNPSTWVNTLEPPDLSGMYQVEVPVENKEKLLELKAKNPDAVAWLQVPNTTINDGIVQTTDNDYYYRRDEYKNYSFQGCVWLDYECDLKGGTKEEVPQNTIIYGHNLGNPQGIADDPNDVEFAQILKFNDPEFAKANPYIYLTTEGEDLVYQVFAAFYTQSKMEPVEYIHPAYKAETFKELTNDMKMRSTLNYPDVKVGSDDKIVLLSTCCYKYGTYAVNKDQRFVLAGKLVKSGNYAETANVEPNANIKEPTF